MAEGVKATFAATFLFFVEWVAGLQRTFLVARFNAASRFWVRFFAAASEAFFARAERSSAVMVSRLRLPPILPPLRADLAHDLREQSLRFLVHTVILRRFRKKHNPSKIVLVSKASLDYSECGSDVRL